MPFKAVIITLFLPFLSLFAGWENDLEALRAGKLSFAVPSVKTHLLVVPLLDDFHSDDEEDEDEAVDVCAGSEKYVITDKDEYGDAGDVSVDFMQRDWLRALPTG